MIPLNYITMSYLIYLLTCLKNFNYLKTVFNYCDFYFHLRYLSFWSDITNCSFTNFYENNEWIFHFFTVWCQHFLKGSIVFIFSFFRICSRRPNTNNSINVNHCRTISPRFYRQPSSADRLTVTARDLPLSRVVAGSVGPTTLVFGS